MNGSVRKRPSGRWQLRVYVGRDPVTGKDRYATRTVNATSKREAERQLPAFIVSLEAKPVATHGTLAHLFNEVIAHLADRDREMSTLRGYRSIADAVNDAIGDMPLDQLTPQHLNRYYTSKRREGLSAAAVNAHHRFIRRSFTLAVKWGWSPTNIADRADPPTGRRKEIEAPPDDRVVALLEAASKSRTPELGFAFTMLAALGCRSGELCGLRWSDIDLDDGTVRIRRAVKKLTRAEAAQLAKEGVHRPGYELTANGLLVGDCKTHAERRLTLGPYALSVLIAHRAEMRDRAKWAGTVLLADGYVLSDSANGSLPWRPHRLTLAQRRIRDRLGFTDRLYDLRHWNTSELLDKGEDVTTVAGRQGHSNKATTYKHYAHMKPAADQRAAKIIDTALFGKPRGAAARKRRKGA